MAVRRRSRKRRPLSEFAQRSHVHAIPVWLLKAGMTALLVAGMWLLIAAWAAPSLGEGLLP